jgi:hypothetical protein
MAAGKTAKAAKPFEQQASGLADALRSLEGDAARLIDSAPESRRREFSRFRDKLTEARLWLSAAQEEA